MKKLVKILLPFLCLNASLLSACGNDNRIQLSFGDIHASSVNDKATLADLDIKIENKESFLMVVGDTSCACWSEFRPVINSYVSNNHIECLFFSYDYFINYNSKYNLDLTKGTTKFVIYERGSVKVELKSSSKDNTLRDTNAFNRFMEGVVRLPKAYLIKEEDYSTVTANGAVVYFERSECGDCSYLNPTILENYIKKHPDMHNIYVLDCQSWKDNLTDEEYQAKKDAYGLSTVNNPNFGYNTGVFPFMSYVKNGEYKSGAVAFNDEVCKVDNKYVVTDSYYTTERENKLDYLANVDKKVLKGLEISSSDVSDNGEFITWEKEKAAKYYEPIIDAFLDTYLPQVNYNL